MSKVIEFIDIRQNREDAIREVYHRVQARRLPDGRVELYVDEQSRKKYNPGKESRWHNATILLTLTPENAAKLTPVFTPAEPSTT